jgi:hypothetical protein
VHQKSRGIVIAAVLILPQDRLEGGFLNRETLKALLAAALIQRLTLEGLLDLTLLRSVLLFLLLGHRGVSPLEQPDPPKPAVATP